MKGVENEISKKWGDSIEIGLHLIDLFAKALSQQQDYPNNPGCWQD